MDVLTYTDARQNLKDVMDQVVADNSHVVVTRRNGEAVVMLSLATWNAIEETMHLRSTPNNTRRLHDAIDQLDKKGGKQRDLAET